MCVLLFENLLFPPLFSINNLRALALQMDEGLGSHVEEFAKELHTESTSNTEGEGEGEDGEDDLEDDDGGYEENQDEPTSP